MEAVLDSLLSPVRATAAEAEGLDDPAAAFRHVFARSCVLPAAEVRAIGAIAASSDRLSAYAQVMIEELIEPVTHRAQAGGCLHPGLTAADIAFFVRMVDIADPRPEKYGSRRTSQRDCCDRRPSRRAGRAPYRKRRSISAMACATTLSRVCGWFVPSTRRNSRSCREMKEKAARSDGVTASYMARGPCE